MSVPSNAQPTDDTFEEDCFPPEIKKIRKWQKKDALKTLNKIRSDGLSYHSTFVDINLFNDCDSDILDELSGNSKQKNHIDFKSLCSRITDQQNRFSAIIGPYGSGKTTNTLEMADYFNGPSSKLLCILQKFSESDHEGNLSCKDFLIKRNCPDLSDADCEKAFQWIKDFPQKVLIIFDGADEASWWHHMDERAPRLRYDTPAPVWQIVSNLFDDHLLEESGIVFTTRFSSMIQITPHLRPKKTYLLANLSASDVQAGLLGKFRVDHDKAEHNWLVIQENDPFLLQLYSSPIFLSNIEGKLPSTSAFKILEKVVVNMGSNINTRSDLRKKIPEVCKLAFAVRLNYQSGFTFSLKDLYKHDLDLKDVQDFVVALPGTASVKKKVEDDKVKVCFSPSCFLDYFATQHVAHLKLSKFKAWLQKCSTGTNMIPVFHLLHGCLFDHSFQCEGKTEKREALVENLKKRLETLTACNTDFFRCVACLREGGDNLLPSIIDLLPTEIIFSDSLTLCQVLAICFILKKSQLPINQLLLVDCELDDDAFRYLVKSIAQMSVQIDKVDFSNNNIGSYPQHVITKDFLNKITTSLSLLNCQKDANGEWQNMSSESSLSIKALAECNQGLAVDCGSKGAQKTFIDEEETPIKVVSTSSTSMAQVNESHRENSINDGVIEEESLSKFDETVEKNESTTIPDAVEKPSLVHAKFRIKEKIDDKHAKIFFAESLPPIQQYCAKAFDITNYESHAEAEVLKDLDHENIVRYICCPENLVEGKVTSCGLKYIFMELCMTNVENYIQNVSNWIDTQTGVCVISDKNIQDCLQIAPLDLLRQVGEGLQYLHSKKIGEKALVHRDIKPSNLLLTKNDDKVVVKISDFGTSKYKSDDQTVDSSCSGTEMYKAPERFNGRISQKSDIFSFGLVAYFVLTNGGHPFGGDKSHKHKVTKNSRKPPCLKKLNELFNVEQEVERTKFGKLTKEQIISARELIKSMLKFEKKKRPDIQKVLAHPLFWKTKNKVVFFEDIYKEKIENKLIKSEKSKCQQLKDDELHKLMNNFQAGLLPSDETVTQFSISEKDLPDSVLKDKAHPVKTCKNVEEFLKYMRHQSTHHTISSTKIQKELFQEKKGDEKWDVFLPKFLKGKEHLLVHLYGIDKICSDVALAKYYS